MNKNKQAFRDVSVQSTERMNKRTDMMPTTRRMPMHFEMTFRTTPNQVMAVTGNTSFLGNWTPEAALRMFTTDGQVWTLDVKCDMDCPTFEYKYLLLDETTGHVLRWEGGNNRWIETTRDQTRMECVDSWNN